MRTLSSIGLAYIVDGEILLFL